MKRLRRRYEVGYWTGTDTAGHRDWRPIRRCWTRRGAFELALDYNHRGLLFVQAVER